MANRNERIVVYASTRNQYDKMETAAKSLLLNTVVDHIYFLTEDEEYPNYLPQCIKTINVKPIVQDYFYEKGPNYETDWSYMTLLRLAIYDLLPQHDFVLYLDTDTLVVDDILELFSTNITDYYYAAAFDASVCTSLMFSLKEEGNVPFRMLRRVPYTFCDYYNAGVMLCNLKKLRDGKGKEMIRMINTEPLVFNDQDAINIACRNKILTLSSVYNSAPMTIPVKDPKIIHLSKTMNEHNKSIWKCYENMSWKWIERQIAINKKKEEEARE